MRADTTIPSFQEAESVLVPSEPPAEDDLLVEGEEWLEIEELEHSCPHNFDEYHKYSLRVAMFQVERPAYLGYPFIPKHPLGVCR
jgi:hypothetical protein